MAQGVRTQVEPPVGWVLALALTAACSDQGPPPATGAPPTVVDTAALSPATVVDAVLTECHAPLRRQMDRVAASITLPDGERLQAYATLPHSLRVVGNAGQYLLRDDTAFVLGDAARPATADELAHLRDLCMLLDRAAFGPLHRAVDCRRTGDASFELAQPDDAPVTLTLRPGTLLPAAFDDVRIDDYLRTPVSWIARRLTHPRLGSCELVFEQSGLQWQDGFFVPPGSTEQAESNAPTANPERIRLATENVESRSPVPVLVETDAVRWLVLDDPGEWSERARQYAPMHALLLAENQRIAGFPILTSIDGRAVLAIPFKPRQAGVEPRLPANVRVVPLPAGRELQVWPPTGDFAARCTSGEELLQQALRRHGLEASGPLRYQPYVHLNEGPPPAAKLADPVVRVIAPVR